MGLSTRTRPPGAWRRSALALALLATSCPAPRDPGLEGASARADTPPSRRSGPEKLPRFDEIGAFPIVSRLRTAHPVGDLAGTIRVDSTAEAYGRAGRGPMAQGAMIVEALAPTPEAAPTLYYVMVRREPGFFSEGGDWEYAVVDKDGFIAAGGKLPLCARCHGEAGREHLFEHVASPP